MLLLRVSFSGEQGYEIHCPRAAVADVYDAVWADPSAERLGLC